MRLCRAAALNELKPDQERDHHAADDQRRNHAGRALLEHERGAGRDQDHAERAAKECLRRLDRELRPDDHARDGAEQDVAGEAEVDVAADPVGSARGPQEDGRVKDVGADHALRREAEDRDQRDRDQGAAAGGSQADDEAAVTTPVRIAAMMWRR